MTDREHQSTDALEARLLASWKKERSSPEAKAAALALFAGAGAATTVAAGAKAAKATVGLSLAAKVTGGVLVTAALVGGSVLATRSSAVPSPSNAPPPKAVVTPPPPAHAPAPAEPAVPAIDVASLPSAPSVARPAAAPPVENAPPAAPSASPPPPESDLKEQVGAIDRARAALARGDTDACLSTLTAYDRAYPNGMLSQEATLLRVQALVQRGDREAARAVAERFLASHPASPHEQRIRRMLEPNP